MQKLTNQLAFNIAAAHLLTQGRKAQDISEKYKTISKGKVLHCGIGCLIPSNLYNMDMEGKGVTGAMFQSFPGINRLFYNCSERLLEEIQTIHDKFDVDKWEGQLRFLAFSHFLDPSILDNYKDKPTHIDQI